MIDIELDTHTFKTMEDMVKMHNGRFLIKESVLNETLPDGVSTTKHEAQVCVEESIRGYEYEDLNYTYSRETLRGDVGEDSKEVWQLNGENHRLGLYPAVSIREEDQTQQLEPIIESEIYAVKGVEISIYNAVNMSTAKEFPEALEQKDSFIQLKRYVDKEFTKGIDPKEAMISFVDKSISMSKENSQNIAPAFKLETVKPNIKILEEKSQTNDKSLDSKIKQETLKPGTKKFIENLKTERAAKAEKSQNKDIGMSR